MIERCCRASFSDSIGMIHCVLGNTAPHRADNARLGAQCAGKWSSAGYSLLSMWTAPLRYHQSVVSGMPIKRLMSVISMLKHCPFINVCCYSRYAIISGSDLRIARCRSQCSRCREIVIGLVSIFLLSSLNSIIAQIRSAKFIN